MGKMRQPISMALTIMSAMAPTHAGLLLGWTSAESGQSCLSRLRAGLNGTFFNSSFVRTLRGSVCSFPGVKLRDLTPQSVM